MTNETDPEALDALAAERADAPPEIPAESGGDQQMPPEIDQDAWAETTDLVHDSATSLLGCQSRSAREKRAFAVTSRNLALKRVPGLSHTEEIAFACVAIPLGLSILLEYLGKRRGADGTEERAPSGNGHLGLGQE